MEARFNHNDAVVLARAPTCIFNRAILRFSVEKISHFQQTIDSFRKRILQEALSGNPFVPLSACFCENYPVDRIEEMFACRVERLKILFKPHYTYSTEVYWPKMNKILFTLFMPNQWDAHIQADMIPDLHRPEQMTIFLGRFLDRSSEGQHEIIQKIASYYLLMLQDEKHVLRIRNEDSFIITAQFLDSLKDIARVWKTRCQATALKAVNELRERFIELELTFPDMEV